MTFEAYETSRASGDPVELYLFQYGAGSSAYFAYTNAEQSIVGDYIGSLPPVEYEPLPIKRTAIRSSGSLDKSELEIRMPRTAGLAELFRIWPPSQVVSLFIRRGHHSDVAEEFFVSWSGRVLSHAFERSEVVFKCEPISTSMRRAGLRRHYQIGCPHLLYGPQCNADKEAATVATTVEAINGRTITLPVAWPGVAESENFLTGMVEWTTAEGNLEVRTILKITNNRELLLSGLVEHVLSVSDAIDVVKGCAHNVDFCADVHNNIHNYGGQPWIPFKSPFGFRNHFF